MVEGVDKMIRQLAPREIAKLTKSQNRNTASLRNFKGEFNCENFRHYLFSPSTLLFDTTLQRELRFHLIFTEVSSFINRPSGERLWRHRASELTRQSCLAKPTIGAWVKPRPSSLGHVGQLLDPVGSPPFRYRDYSDRPTMAFFRLPIVALLSFIALDYRWVSANTDIRQHSRRQT